MSAFDFKVIHFLDIAEITIRHYPLIIFLIEFVLNHAFKYKPWLIKIDILLIKRIQTLLNQLFNLICATQIQVIEILLFACYTVMNILFRLFFLLFQFVKLFGKRTIALIWSTTFLLTIWSFHQISMSINKFIIKFKWISILDEFILTIILNLLLLRLYNRCLSNYFIILQYWESIFWFNVTLLE